MYINIIITVKWLPLKFATLLQLLKPVASSWQQLASFLLPDNLQYNIKTIQTNAFHNNQGALMEVLRKWRDCTTREKRTWKTLCDTAERYEDNSLTQYIQEKHLENDCEFNVIISTSVILKARLR